MAKAEQYLCGMVGTSQIWESKTFGRRNVAAPNAHLDDNYSSFVD